jgi:hypothetical protein
VVATTYSTPDALITDVGKGTAGKPDGEKTGSYFMVDTDGLMWANNAVI